MRIDYIIPLKERLPQKKKYLHSTEWNVKYKGVEACSLGVFNFDGCTIATNLQ